MPFFECSDTLVSCVNIHFLWVQKIFTLEYRFCLSTIQGVRLGYNQQNEHFLSYEGVITPIPSQGRPRKDTVISFDYVVTIIINPIVLVFMHRQILLKVTCKYSTSTSIYVVKKKIWEEKIQTYQFNKCYLWLAVFSCILGHVSF